jgi:hypothetical protein
LQVGREGLRVEVFFGFDFFLALGGWGNCALMHWFLLVH